MFSSGINDSLMSVSSASTKSTSSTTTQDDVVIADGTENEIDFLTLMVEQLKNQDPLDPLDTEDYTTMLAQLNSVEQLISINSLLEEVYSNSQLANGAAMIGKYVEGLDSDNNFVTGVVDQVEQIEGETALVIGDQLLLVTQVLLVDDAAST